MSKIYDSAVVIGRFQPLHDEHLNLIKEAGARAKRVIICFGSADSPRCPDNPFTFEERMKMVYECLIEAGFLPEEFSFLGINDSKYNDDRWFAQVQSKVAGITGPNEDICIVGHEKDDSSFYLKKFPEWDLIRITPRRELSATDVRLEYFLEINSPFQLPVPNPVKKFLKEFFQKPEWNYLYDWFVFDEQNKEIWKDSPYPVIFTCVDNMVVQSGHILLIQRKFHPGKGLWALPGGYVNVKERFIDAAVRELKEETRISDKKGQIPPAMLKSFIDDSKTKFFDDPRRSSRCRVTTMVYYYEIPFDGELLSVAGDDDADKAQWVPLSKLHDMEFFEDHKSIISYYLNVP